MSEDEKKREKEKGELEKLVDWEQNKQLFWAVVLLTATLGLAEVLVIDSLSTSTRFFVIVIGLILMGALDMSFYRLAISHVNLKRYIEGLGKLSKLYKNELLDNVIFKWYDWFVDTTNKDEPHLRIWRVRLIIVFADIFILSYIGLILSKLLGY